MLNLHCSTIFPNMIQVLPLFPNVKLQDHLKDILSTWILCFFYLSTRDFSLFF